MPNLKIYRASAGSGKTHTLTEEYINILFSNTLEYQKVLAVTFTNKATADMRRRILESLYNLSDTKKKSPKYLKSLMDTHKMNETQVRTKAGIILHYLLHDYSRFSVSTIDSFFQSIVRSFALELGLPNSFRVELQPGHIMIQSIDSIILEMDKPEKRELKKWLIDFAESKMQQDQGWNITREIRHISEAIYTEFFQQNVDALWGELSNKDNLNNYRQTLREIISNADNKMKDISLSALKTINDKGLDISNDFNRKSVSPVKIFMKMNDLNSFAGEKSYLKLIDNIDNWTRKDNPAEKNSFIIEAYNENLNQKLKEATYVLATCGKDYFTADAILENLNALGIITDVSIKMADLCRENNLFLISGTNNLLNKIIDNNETPFIYEKTGVKYSHFMIDEFQDTSAMQYNNFKPLINESLATNNSTLVVGDIKQAIYRWRNSDWSLLATKVEDDFRINTPELKSLYTNWRSHEVIVNFNNHFFSKAPKLLQESFINQIPQEIRDNKEFVELENKIINAYQDVFQNVSPDNKESGGNVTIKFFEGDKKENDEEILFKLVEEVTSLLKSGISFSEISILVRSNSTGIMVTDALLSGLYHPNNQSIPVISNESLLLNGCEAIRLLVSQLKYILNPTDRVNESFIRLMWVKNCKNDNYDKFDISEAYCIKLDKEWQEYKTEIIGLKNNSIFELTEALVRRLPEPLKTHYAVYLQSFMSLILGFTNEETADLSNFLEYWDKNSDKFSLNIPEGQDAIRVMTIHKSKGLEFKSVIIPFFSWDLISWGSKSLLWLKPNTAPFNKLALVPVSLKKDLVYSHFVWDYSNEILNQYIDNLNLTYVAFTRACENLTIFGTKKNLENSNIQTVGDLLYKFLNEEIKDGKWSTDLLEYNLNVKVKRKEENYNEELRPKKLIEINEIKSFAHKNKVLIHTESDEYFQDDSLERKVNYGRIMHQVFENILETKDIDYALKLALAKGRITLNDFSLLKEQTYMWLNDSRVKSWFDGTYTVKTEAGILWEKQKRPDRVMFGNNSVIVVDYKFGDKKSPDHINQVQGYLRIISKMGYKNITGYLWYVTISEIIEVKVQNSLFD